MSTKHLWLKIPWEVAAGITYCILHLVSEACKTQQKSATFATNVIPQNSLKKATDANVPRVW